MSAVRFPSALFLCAPGLCRCWEGDNGTFGIWDTTSDDCFALTSINTSQVNMSLYEGRKSRTTEVKKNPLAHDPNSCVFERCATVHMVKTHGGDSKEKEERSTQMTELHHRRLDKGRCSPSLWLYEEWVNDED